MLLEALWLAEMLMAKEAIPNISAALSPGGDYWRGGRAGNGVLEALPGSESYLTCGNEDKACKPGR